MNILLESLNLFVAFMFYGLVLLYIAMSVGVITGKYVIGEKEIVYLLFRKIPIWKIKFENIEWMKEGIKPFWSNEYKIYSLGYGITLRLKNQWFFRAKTIVVYPAKKEKQDFLQKLKEKAKQFNIMINN